VVSDQKNYDKSMAACRKLEKQYGLVNAKEAGQDNRRAKREQLPARDAAKSYIQDSESRHKPHAASVEELLAAMKLDGINAQTKYQGGELQVVVFEYQGHFIKGSELGRESSGSGLVKTIDAQRDTILAQRAAVAQVGAPGIRLGAELESFGQQVGAQLQANEKAEKQALEQKQRELSRGIQPPTPTIEKSGEIEM
jgi:hypothetical protein